MKIFINEDGNNRGAKPGGIKLFLGLLISPYNPFFKLNLL